MSIKVKQQTIPIKNNEQIIIQSDPILKSFRKFLTSNGEIELPTPPSQEKFAEQGIDYTAEKIAWWTLMNLREVLPDAHIEHPELHDEKIQDSVMVDTEEYMDIEEFFKDWDNESQSSASSSTRESSERTENTRSSSFIVGVNSLHSTTVRKPGTSIESNTFINIFDTSEREINYEKEQFKTKCLLCKEEIQGQRQLADHMEKLTHKTNFRNLSLEMGQLQYSEKKLERTVYDSGVFSAKLKKYFLEELRKVPCPLSIKLADEDQKELHPSITASIKKEDYDILLDDQSQNDAKNCLIMASKWTDSLQKKWDEMKVKEKRIIEEYKLNLEKYISNNRDQPHPQRGTEWSVFWTRRCRELKQRKINPDTYNFKPEWSNYWLKRLKEILKEDAYKTLVQMKKDYGLDSGRLRTMLNNDNWQDLSKTETNMPRQNKSKNSKRSSRGGNNQSHSQRSQNCNPNRQISPWATPPYLANNIPVHINNNSLPYGYRYNSQLYPNNPTRLPSLIDFPHRTRPYPCPTYPSYRFFPNDVHYPSLSNSYCNPNFPNYLNYYQQFFS